MGVLKTTAVLLMSVCLSCKRGTQTQVPPACPAQGSWCQSTSHTPERHTQHIPVPLYSLVFPSVPQHPLMNLLSFFNIPSSLFPNDGLASHHSCFFFYFEDNFPFWGQCPSLESEDMSWHLRQNSSLYMGICVALAQERGKTNKDKPTTKFCTLFTQSHFSFHPPPLSLHNSGSLSSQNFWIH